MLDRVLSLQQAADCVGIHFDTFYRMIGRGEGPPVAQLSTRRVGIRESKLWAWVEERERVREDERAA